MTTDELRKMLENEGLALQNMQTNPTYYVIRVKDGDRSLAKVSKVKQGDFAALIDCSWPVVLALASYSKTPIPEREVNNRYEVYWTQEQEKALDMLLTKEELRKFDFIEEIEGQFYMRLKLEEHQESKDK